MTVTDDRAKVRLTAARRAGLEVLAAGARYTDDVRISNVTTPLADVQEWRLEAHEVPLTVYHQTAEWLLTQRLAHRSIIADDQLLFTDEGRALAADLGLVVAPAAEPEPAPPAEPVTPAAGDDGPESADHLAEIPVDLIDPSHDNPRVDMGDHPADDGDDGGPSSFDQLVESIREQGVIQPLIVRPADDGRFRLVAGERRLTAAMAAGLATVPCIVRNLDDHAAIEQTIIENRHRKDWNPVEEARAFETLVDEFGLSQREIAQRFSCTQPHVSHRLGLLRLKAHAPWALTELTKPRPALRVEQATLLATMHDAPERLDRLGGKLGHGSFDMFLRNELAGYQHDKKRAGLIADLEEQGVPIRPTYSLKDLVGAHPGPVVDLDAHRGEPCHAAAVDHSNQVLFLCTDPARHTPDGASDLKASNFAPADDAPASPAPSSAGPSRPAGAPASRTADGTSDAPAGEPGTLDLPPGVEEPALPVDIEKSPEQLAREENQARRAALADCTGPRHAQIRQHMTTVKPTKADVVTLAHQLVHTAWAVGDPCTLAHWLLPAEDGLDWRTVDDSEAGAALVAYVESGELAATKFVYAFGLLLGEDPIDNKVRNATYQGVEVGEFADDPVVRRHYERLAAMGWEPRPAERAVIEPTPESDDDPAVDDQAPASSDNDVIDPSGSGVGVREILDADELDEAVAFFDGDGDREEERFVDAAEAAAIESSGRGDRLWRIVVTAGDESGPTAAVLVAWGEPDDFGRTGSEAVVGGEEFEVDDHLAPIDGAADPLLGGDGEPAAAEVVPTPDAAAGDPPDWMTCERCHTFGAVDVRDKQGAIVAWERCPAGHEPRRRGDRDVYEPGQGGFGTNYWYDDDPDDPTRLLAHVAPFIPATVCIVPDCVAKSSCTRGLCSDHAADVDYVAERWDPLAHAAGQPDKLVAPLANYHDADVLEAAAARAADLGYEALG